MFFRFGINNLNRKQGIDKCKGKNIKIDRRMKDQKYHEDLESRN
jgi:hypothetical protein